MPEEPEVQPAESSEVQLIIRSAYQSAEDISFSCSKTWTIRQIKEHVSGLLPNHPSISSQRLIFSGSSLKDEMVLGNILAEKSVVDGAQVFHLVCAQPYVNQEVRQRNVGARSPQASSQQAPQSVPAAAPTNTDWNQWWAAHGQNQTQGNVQNQYANYYNEWMRYYYAQQYYSAVNQAMHFAQQQDGAQQNGNTNTPVPNAVNNGGMVFNAQIPNMMGQQVGAPVRNPVVAANPAARVDILEIFYRLFKVVLLFSAVLLYSSFERFAVVLSAALFIYFIQLRRNNARNRMQQAPEVPPQPQNDGRVNNNNTGENENATGNGNENNAAEPTATPAEPAPPSPSTMQVFLATCYSFITSFFASLVPDHPIPVDIN